jgi:hypothetical protein
MNRRLLLALSALAAALSGNPAAAGPQAYVASNGSDANARRGCPDNRPCRTFAAALGVVDAGGEVIAVDPADYGPATITKSVTLVGNGYAGIAAAAGAAIVIATPDVDVALRGLSINGGATSTAGVSMTKGRSLSVENCVISGMFTGIGVDTAARVRVVNSMLRNTSYGVRIGGGASGEIASTQFFRSSSSGLWVDANTAATTSVSVSDSVAADGGFGFAVYAGNAGGIGSLSVIRSTAANNNYGFASTAAPGSATITVGSSMASGNHYGFANIPGVVGLTPGTFESLGDNSVRQNVTNSLGIITPVSPL